MAKYEQRKTNKTVGQVVIVPCLKCKNETKHEVLVSLDVSGETEDDVQYDWHDQIIECKGCETATFRTISSSSEDFDDEPNEQLFPSRSAGRAAIQHSYYLPGPVRRIYDETIGALNNDHPVLAGIGLRALVETVCKDQNAVGYNLVERINDLVTKGVLTAKGAAILHKVRTLGNNAAHEVEPHTSAQLGIAMDVCEHLLHDVYIIHRVAQSL